MGCEGFRVRGFEGCKVLGIECTPYNLSTLRPFHLETSPGLSAVDFGAAVEVVESAASYFGKVP